MTVVDHSHVAVVEMLSELRRMREHCGPEFQVTSKTLKQALREHFGGSFTGKGAGGKLLRHVVGTLVERGVLEVWDERDRNRKLNLVIYAVDTTLLHE